MELLLDKTAPSPMSEYGFENWPEIETRLYMKVVVEMPSYLYCDISANSFYVLLQYQNNEVWSLFSLCKTSLHFMDWCFEYCKVILKYELYCFVFEDACCAIWGKMTSEKTFWEQTANVIRPGSIFKTLSSDFPIVWKLEVHVQLQTAAWACTDGLRLFR